MKKTLLALSLFVASSGIAQAQSVVVLSGQLDVALGANVSMMQWPFREDYNLLRESILPKKASDAPVLYAEREIGLVRSPNGGSYIRLYGEEAFSNGLSLFFRTQADFDYNGYLTGGSTYWSHESVFGVKGDDFGDLSFGRQPSASAQFSLNPFANFNIYDRDVVGDAGGSTNNSTLAYQTPEALGFRLGVSYDGKFFQVYDTNKGEWGIQPDAYNHFSLGLSYRGDLFSGALTFDQLNTKEDELAKRKPPRAFTLGALLDFDRVKAYYRFAYADHGFANSIGERLYKELAIVPKDPEGHLLLPPAKFSGYRRPLYSEQKVTRYANELGVLLRLSERFELRLTDQFEYSRQPVSQVAIPIFIKGDTPEGKTEWYNEHAANTKPAKYVISSRVAHEGDLKLYTNVVKAALIYHLFARADFYAFTDYAYTSGSLETGKAGDFVDLVKGHYVYGGVGITLSF